MWLPKDDFYNSDVVNTIRDGLKSAVIMERVLDKTVIYDDDFLRMKDLIDCTDWEKYQHRNYFLDVGNMNEVRETRYLTRRIKSTGRIPMPQEEFQRLASNQEVKDALSRIGELLKPFQKQQVE